MGNSNLNSAKREKNDEFYTQWKDIENEMNAYLEYNPDVFRDKVILLPCDDPTWSNFTKYFALRFDYLGLKKLISTSYAPNSNKSGQFYTPQESLFEGLEYDEETDFERGKIFILENDEKTRDGVVNIDDIQWEYLQGDGDFRSPEVTKLRDEADFIITNPPFSLFREFIEWTLEGDCQFAAIGSMNAITYKEVFPLIKENKVWLGYTSPSLFEVPIDNVQNESNQLKNDETGQVLQKFGNIYWFTNIPHGKRHEPLSLMTKADNERFSKKVTSNPHAYRKYDNYDAMEVPSTNAIPSDYKGVMGVPISFLTKYCPEQFEILGGWNDGKEVPNPGAKTIECLNKNGTTRKYRAPVVDKPPKYFRILIKHKNPESSPENPS